MLKKIKNEFVSKEFLANLVLLAIIRRQVININMKKFFSLCCVYIVLHSFNLVHAEEPKFIEVYATRDVDLSDYVIINYQNGSSASSYAAQVSGILKKGEYMLLYYNF